ncbi:2-keto-4-pentenoate hydratase [Bacillus massiliigorillae]|uniref:2-keto-4-pentenoate hydratase n=1 Tax=Bacillus massiliigorillae TaxID=1243664 RepID=UPI0003A7368F|nr:2-keto-4-pentenoate hydratase [Bacillus massiliigorillae]
MTVQSSKKTEELAHLLYNAEQKREGISPLSADNPNLSIDEAYQIQLINIQKKLNEGQIITGKKIGLTSKSMQNLLGVNQPDYGHLLNGMEFKNGSVIPASILCQPKIEAEIAFKLKKDLTGPNITSLDVLLATEYIVPAFEIVDSRVEDWKITIEDTVADNASSGLYVLGEQKFEVSEIDLAQLGMGLYKNGKLMNTGVGAAVLGHPANCVAWLAVKLAEYDIPLKAGEIILSGALSAAVAINPGDQFTARFAGLGEVSVSIS